MSSDELQQYQLKLARERTARIEAQRQLKRKSDELECKRRLIYT